MENHRIIVCCVFLAVVNISLCTDAKYIESAKRRRRVESPLVSSRLNFSRNGQLHAFLGIRAVWTSGAEPLNLWEKTEGKSYGNGGMLAVSSVATDKVPEMQETALPVPSVGSLHWEGEGEGRRIDQQTARQSSWSEGRTRKQENAGNSHVPPIKRRNRPNLAFRGFRKASPKFSRLLNSIRKEDERMKGMRLSTSVRSLRCDSVSSPSLGIRFRRKHDTELPKAGGRSKTNYQKFKRKKINFSTVKGDTVVHVPTLRSPVVGFVAQPFPRIWRWEVPQSPSHPPINIGKFQLSPNPQGSRQEPTSLSPPHSDNGHKPGSAQSLLDEFIDDSRGVVTSPAAAHPKIGGASSTAADEPSTRVSQLIITSLVSPMTLDQETHTTSGDRGGRETSSVGVAGREWRRRRRSVDNNGLIVVGESARSSSGTAGLNKRSRQTDDSKAASVPGTTTVKASSESRLLVEGLGIVGVTGDGGSGYRTRSDNGLNGAASMSIGTGSVASQAMVATVPTSPPSVSSSTLLSTKFSPPEPSTTMSHPSLSSSTPFFTKPPSSPSSSSPFSSKSPSSSSIPFSTKSRSSSKSPSSPSSSIPFSMKFPSSFPSSTSTPSFTSSPLSASSSTVGIERAVTVDSLTSLSDGLGSPPSPNPKPPSPSSVTKHVTENNKITTATTTIATSAAKLSTSIRQSSAATGTSTDKVTVPENTYSEFSLYSIAQAENVTSLNSSDVSRDIISFQGVTSTAHHKQPDQPVTREENKTPYSREENKEMMMSPTDKSKQRRPRSTESSSPSPPTRPPTAIVSDNNTTTTTTTAATSTTTTTTTTTTLIPSTPLTLSTSPLPPQSTSETVDPTSTGSTSPTTPAPPVSSPPAPPSSSSPISPEDLFGDMWTADPVPYPEGEPYPQPDGRIKDQLDTQNDERDDEEPAAEPGPDWVNAKRVWRGAWQVHLYVFTTLFGSLAVYTLISVLRLWRIHRLLSRRYFVSLNLLMLLLCLTRSFYLAVDGYNSNGTFHPSLDYFFYSISFPCLTSAFSIQLYALLQATKMQFLPPTIQKVSVLSIIVVVHFVISITTDVIVGMYAGMEVMLFICQLFFILWGLFLFFGYAYIFRRLYLQAVKRQKNMVQGPSKSNGGGIAKPKSKFTLSVAVKVTFCTAILGLVTLGLELYAVVGVYKTFSEDRPDPWPWYLYHTALRLVEFLMCATMSYVASQPFRYRRDQQACCCPVLCAPCAEICCCGADVNKSGVQAAWSDMEHPQQLRASVDRGQPPHLLTYRQHQYSFHNNNSYNVGLFDQKESVLGGDSGGGDGGGSSNPQHVKPVVTSQPAPRTTFDTPDIVAKQALFSGGSMGINSDGAFVDQKPRDAHGDAASPIPHLPVNGSKGVVNTAFLPTVDDPQNAGIQSPESQDFKSRKSSIASSEFFLGASLSLADSMASELDKAFRSMHEEEEDNDLNCPSEVSLTSMTSTSGKERQPKQPTNIFPEDGSHKPTSTFLQDHSQKPFSSDQGQKMTEAGDTIVSRLPRSHSEAGRCIFHVEADDEKEECTTERRTDDGDPGESMNTNKLSCDTAWHQKLFRSRSDHKDKERGGDGIRTKDVAKATYMSLVDIERQQSSADREDPFNSSSTQTTLCSGDGQTSGVSCSPEDSGGHDQPKLCISGEFPGVGKRSSADRDGGSQGVSCRGTRPSPPYHDLATSEVINEVQASSQPQFHTVISVGGGGKEMGCQKAATTSSSSSSFGSPSPPKLMSSPQGLLNYCHSVDDDIEV